MDTEYVLNLSYGKDSLAAVHVWVDILKMPLHRIVHAEVWATDTIPADLPPMMEFKSKADRIIKDRWGIDVEHVVATSKNEILTYEKIFYRKFSRGGKSIDYTDIQCCEPLGVNQCSKVEYSTIYGFPFTGKGMGWCHELKKRNLRISYIHQQGELVHKTQTGF